MDNRTHEDPEVIKAERLGISPAQLQVLRSRVTAARNGRVSDVAAKYLNVTPSRFRHLLAALTDSPLSDANLADARAACRIVLWGSEGVKPTSNSGVVFVVDGRKVYHSMAACPALEDARPHTISLSQAKAAGRTKCLRCKEFEESKLLTSNPAENNIGPAKDRKPRSKRRRRPGTQR